MGGFYGSVQIRGVARGELQDVLEKLSRKLKTRFLLGPVLGDWVGVYPEGSGQDTQIGVQIAANSSASYFTSWSTTMTFSSTNITATENSSIILTLVPTILPRSPNESVKSCVVGPNCSPIWWVIPRPSPV